jgi:hypothetical protein
VAESEQLNFLCPFGPAHQDDETGEATQPEVIRAPRARSALGRDTASARAVADETAFQKSLLSDPIEFPDTAGFRPMSERKR